MPPCGSRPAAGPCCRGLVRVSVLSFLLADVTRERLRRADAGPQVSPATINALRDRYGLDRPLVEKYAHWLGSLLRGDLSYSVAHNTPVGELLWPRARNTLFLTVTAMSLAWLMAVPLGAWAASRREHWPDPRDRGRYDHAARRPGPAPGTHPAASRRSHRVFPDRWDGLDRLRRSWRVGQGKGRRDISFCQSRPWRSSTYRCSCGTCARA